MADPSDTDGQRRRPWGGAPLVAAVCGIAAASSGLHPSGLRWADPVWLAASVAALSLLAGRARPWCSIVVGLVAAALCAAPAGTVVAILLVVGGAWAARTARWTASVAAAVGGGAAVVVIFGSLRHPRALTAAVVAVAVVALLVSAYLDTDRFGRQIAQDIVLGLAITAVAGLGITALAGHAAVKDARYGVTDLERAVDAARAGDQATAISKFTEALVDLRSAKQSLRPWAMFPGRVLPGLGPNLSALQVALDQGIAVAAAGRHATEALNVSQLKRSDGGIDLEAIERAGPKLDALIEAMDAARGSFDRLRSPFLVPAIDRRLTSVRDRLTDALVAARPASQLANAAPDLLGQGGVRRYLVLFTTQSESRASGFPGNFAELTAYRGKLSMSRFGRNTDLNKALQNAGGLKTGDFPKDFVARYGALPITTDWRFITLSPDFPTVASIARLMYERSGFGAVDGVIRLDPKALAGLLRITGPVSVPGRAQALTAKTAADYLERGQYTSFDANAERIDALETLGHDVFARLVGGALPSPSTLGKVFGPMVQRGDLDVAVTNPVASRALHAVGAAGAVPERTAHTDDLGVILNNIGSNKLDAYTDRNLTYEADWSPSDHRVTATATITVHNRVDPSGLPSYVRGCGCYRFVPGVPPNAIGVNRSWVTVYSRLRLDSATIDGRPAKLTTQRELGRYAYSVIVDVRPGSTSVIGLELSGTVHDDAGYHLLIWGQALPRPGEVSASIRRHGSTDTSSAPAQPFDRPLEVVARR